MGAAPRRDRPDRLEQLTGMRSSKGSFYAEYSRTAAALNRAIQALEAISSALCTTTSGPRALAHAVLDAAAGQLGAPWTVMVVTGQLLPAFPPVIARDPAGAFLVGRDPLPAELGELVDAVLGSAPAAATTPRDRTLVAPMALGGVLVGALVAAVPGDRPVDEIDVSILHTLANQAVVALRNAGLFEESERLRAQAERHSSDLEQRNRQLQAARRRLLEAEQRQLLHEERSRIARELHDSVAQNLLGIGMTVEWCRPLVEQHPEVHERLGAAKELARAAVEQVRAAIFALSSSDDRPDGELPAALDRLGRSFDRLADLKVTVRVEGTQRLLDPEVEQALYLIGREAMFNVARHGRASGMTVTVGYEPRRVRLTLRDDGLGDAAALRARLAQSQRAADGHHRGLVNMAERARRLGGELRITRARGGGIRLGVTVPLGSPDAPAPAGPAP
jgi:signal transduction histidine kinase